MARIFITGSADGLGLLSAQALVTQGHKVVLHARNQQRGVEAMQKARGAETVLTADLSSTEETKKLADAVNKLGAFDVVIHNAGVYQAQPSNIFAVNTLAPYILTSLIQKPRRLIYLSSGLHMSGTFNPEAFQRGSNGVTYADSKLHVVMLSMAVARIWPGVYSNAVNPGWVPTKMGGAGAPDDLQRGYETQMWLATSDEANAKVSGKYFFHQKEKSSNPTASNVMLQQKFLSACEEITGIPFPI